MDRLALLPLIAAAAALTAAAPAAAATWPAPARIPSAPPFVPGLEAGATADGTVAADWAVQDGVGNGAAPGARGASLAPGQTAFGPERALPRDLAQLAPYGRHSVAALLFRQSSAGARDRPPIAVGSPAGPSLRPAPPGAAADVPLPP